MTEKEVLKSVSNSLKNLILTNDILWFSRLNAGKINSGHSWIQLCEIGTPDIVSIVNCEDGTISALFIECKRTGVKKLRFEQQRFFEMMEGKPKTMCVIINDPKQLWSAIKKAKAL